MLAGISNYLDPRILLGALQSRRDPKIGRLMAMRDAVRNRAFLRAGMWLAVLSHIAYGILDWYLFPDLKIELVAVRVIFGVVFLAALEAGIALRFRLFQLQLISATAIVVGALSWLFVARETEFQSNFAFFSIYGSIFILGTNLYFRFRFYVSVCTTLIITTFYAANSFGINVIGLWAQITLSFFFVNCFVLSLYLSWRMDIARYRNFISALETKVREKQGQLKRRRLEVIAETDPLTGLANRRAVERLFAKLIAETESEKGYVAALLIDVDFFKSYNDLLGHQAGDKCLVALTKSLQAVANKNDAIVGRYGGEEFVVFCKKDDPKKVMQLASDFCDQIEALEIPHPGRSDKGRFVTISAGASYCTLELKPKMSQMIDEADHALYRAKSAGRATFRIYNETFHERENSSFGMLKSIETAVADERISAVFQPIIDVESGELYGHETLMRVQDTFGNPLSPEFFIPIAEDSGMIIEMGRWILDNACAEFAKSRTGDLFSVNVSVIQLRDPAFPLFVISAIARHNLKPSNLAIEITESTSLLEDRVAKLAIQQLRDAGVQIWLDDFGTGFAGLKWLRDVEFDLLKIDRLFLHDCSSQAGRNLLSDMVNLAKNRNLKVLVEGVETQEQFEFLDTINVGYAQGYHIGKPKPQIQELVEFRDAV